MSNFVFSPKLLSDIAQRIEGDASHPVRTRAFQYEKLKHQISRTRGMRSVNDQAAFEDRIKDVIAAGIVYLQAIEDDKIREVANGSYSSST